MKKIILMDGFLDKPIGISSNAVLQKLERFSIFVKQVMSEL